MVASLTAPPFAAKTRDGKTLEVRPAHAGLGRIYYALPRRENQLYFESNAPLAQMKGHSDIVLGYAVADSEQTLIAGEWHIPVDSLRTGIASRDQRLREARWFNASDHPDFVFQLDRIADLTHIDSTTEHQRYSGTLIGDLTINGVTRRREIEGVTFAFLGRSEATARVARGDLLKLSARFDIRLEDHDVFNADISSERFSSIFEADLLLYMTTARP